MKKVFLISLAVALMMVPFALRAQVEPLAGSMTLGAHIDFVGRYSAESNADPDPEEVYWAGYETFNLEAAIIYLMGQVGDNIDYAIGLALAMPGYSGDVVTPSGTTSLLDAKITWSVTDTVALNMGRYIPHTSMSMQPHQLSVHKLIDPPMMITGGGYVESALGTGGVVLIPLPRYQTGVGIEAAMGPATITWDLFNGSETVAAVDNLTEMDKSKGGALKVAVDSGGFHGGIFYLNELSDVGSAVTGLPIDGVVTVTQYGIELAYVTERLALMFEYLDSTADPREDELLPLTDDIASLHQVTYYLLAAVGLGPVELVLRFDGAEAGLDQWMDDSDIDVDEDEVFDVQANITLGVNYPINDNTTVAFNYVMRGLEEPDVEIGGDDVSYPVTDEIAVMVELDVL